MFHSFIRFWYIEITALREVEAVDAIVNFSLLGQNQEYFMYALILLLLLLLLFHLAIKFNSISIQFQFGSDKMEGDILDGLEDLG